MPASEPRVAVLMGSDSDLPALEKGLALLEELGISLEVRVLSAHRTPDDVKAFVTDAETRGVGVFIAAAGGAAHLAGAVAASTTRPVIGIPMEATALGGLDALLSTVQMPPGIPVATVSTGKWGGVNAVLLAAQILALSDPDLDQRVKTQRATAAQKVRQKDQAVRDRFSKS